MDVDHHDGHCRASEDGERDVRTDVRDAEKAISDAIDHVPIVDGTAAIDEALVTGESVPQRKSVGDEVLGGSVLTDGAIVVEVGADASSTIDRLVELLWSVKSSGSGVQRLVNRFAVVFVPLVIGLSVLTTVGSRSATTRARS